MTRICDGTPGDKPCPRRNPCEGDCHFNSATLDQPMYDCLVSDRKLTLVVWAFITVIVFTLALPIVWLIGMLI